MSKHYLDDSKVIYSFNQDNLPVIEIAAGDTITVKTKDCFANQLSSEEDSVKELDWNQINPATGPIAVKGAKPGDTLKVEILDIRVENITSALYGNSSGPYDAI